LPYVFKEWQLSTESILVWSVMRVCRVLETSFG